MTGRVQLWQRLSIYVRIWTFKKYGKHNCKWRKERIKPNESKVYTAITTRYK